MKMKNAKRCLLIIIVFSLFYVFLPPFNVAEAKIEGKTEVHARIAPESTEPTEPSEDGTEVQADTGGEQSTGSAAKTGDYLWKWLTLQVLAVILSFSVIVFLGVKHRHTEDSP